eukprot:GAHX01003353.1.p3 GENE.GAHX01003353.1~~GAHX01003353.1.p3  ORF type:complete len:58 (-),score=9.93 GAHX01003353.1:959-1132(-)
MLLLSEKEKIRRIYCYYRTLKLFKTKGVQNSMKEFDDDLNKINKHHSSVRKTRKHPI